MSMFDAPLFKDAFNQLEQAADIMEARLKDLNIDMVHIIGPETGHKIHSDSKTIIESKMDSLSEALANETPTRHEL